MLQQDFRQYLKSSTVSKEKEGIPERGHFLHLRIRYL